MPVGLVFGGVEIQNDLSRPPMVVRELCQHELLQPPRRPHEIAAAHTVLEAAQDRLRSELPATDGVTIQGQLEHSVVAQSRAVVAVGVAERDAEHPLPNQVEHRVLDLPLLPQLGDLSRESCGQAETIVELPQQDQAPVRTRGLSVERDHGRLREIWEENSLSIGVGHARARWFVAGWLESPPGTILPLSNSRASRVVRARLATRNPACRRAPN